MFSPTTNQLTSTILHAAICNDCVAGGGRTVPRDYVADFIRNCRADGVDNDDLTDVLMKLRLHGDLSPKSV